jgi:hypothetical protein
MERIPIISPAVLRHDRSDESCGTGVVWNVDGVIMSWYTDLLKIWERFTTVVETLRVQDIAAIARYYI